MTPRILLPLLIALALCAPPVAQARNSSKPRATPVHHHTTIESVSADSITVNSADGSTKTYKITSGTEITFKGETVPASQLQAGMRVSVTADAADDSVAGQITANDPPKSPTPKPKK